MSDNKREMREAFLDLLADGEWSIEYDADINSSGHAVDCSQFILHVSMFSFQQFCDAIGVERKHREQSLDDALQEAIEAPREANKPQEAT